MYIVKEVILPDMLENFDGTESLCVCYEHKKKPAVYTKEKNILLNRQDEITATFNETLEIEVTMYVNDSKTGQTFQVL